MAEGSSWLRINIRSGNMELIAKYHVETDLPIRKAAEAIAAEQSTGTWTDVRGADNPLAARVISAEGNKVEIGFPEELFEPGNVPQYLSVVAGNLFGLGALKKVRLQDIIFPESLLSAHKGPRFGIEDARKILGVYDRPFVGTIVKPKVGLDPAGTARGGRSRCSRRSGPGQGRRDPHQSELLPARTKAGGGHERSG